MLSFSSLAAAERQNVLFIIVDDLRVELPVYGRAHIKAPNIEKLASEGIVFDNAYANMPVCGASRASLMTGIRPTRTLFVGNEARIEIDTPNAVPLHTLLKANGYHTESLGKVIHNFADAADGWTAGPWHPKFQVPKRKSTGPRDYQIAENIRRFKEDGFGPAFEAANLPDNAYYDGKIAERAVESLQGYRHLGRPFFLAVGFLKPHLPFNAPKKYWDLYSETDIRLALHSEFPARAPKAAWHDWRELRGYADIPKAPALMPDPTARRLIHGYYASVSYTDTQVGKVLHALQEYGLADNTIVVLIGDHGWSLGEHGLWGKHATFDVATRSPLIVRIPNGPARSHAKGLVEFVDIYPTLVELLGISAPGHLQGRSFVTQIMDPLAPGKEAVFPRWQKGEVIKTDDFALTEWFDDSGKSIAKMLYDHRTDRDETVNVANQPDYGAVIDELRQKLKTLMHER